MGDALNQPGHDPQQNRILGALPNADLLRLQPHLKLMQVPAGHVIYEAGENLHDVYFPTTSVVCKMHMMADGASAEIAMVGNEGFVGIAAIMGGESTTHRAVTQKEGHAYRLTIRAVQEEFRRGGAMLHLLLRFTQTLIIQMAQTAVCNRYHSIDEQLCRWLLLSLDRQSSPELVMTQESIAAMLGVRREGVTEAAGKLQSAGLIRYSRGRIDVLDRAGLETRACECYRIMEAECDRLLPKEIPTYLSKIGITREIEMKSRLAKNPFAR